MMMMMVIIIIIIIIIIMQRLTCVGHKDAESQAQKDNKRFVILHYIEHLCIDEKKTKTV